MKVLKEADKTIVVDLDIITYKITIENDNKLAIFNVVVTDNIPECTSFIPESIELNGVPVSGGDIVSGVNIDAIPAGGSVTVTFKVKVDLGCNKCSIENVAFVKYILSGTNNSSFSNILVIPRKCIIDTDPCNPLTDKYVVPGPGTQSKTEIVILTDEEKNGGVMTLPGNTLALSSEAVKLLNKALIEQYPSTVYDLNPTNNYSILSLLVSLSNAGIISFLDTPPTKGQASEFDVTQGGIINGSSSADSSLLPPIIAQYPGRVICIPIGDWITVYIYFSDKSLPSINCQFGVTTGYDAISNFGPFGYTIFPEPIGGAMGSNCGACGVCGVCGGCALCGPSAIAGAASAALASAASLASTSVAFAKNFPR